MLAGLPPVDIWESPIGGIPEPPTRPEDEAEAPGPEVNVLVVTVPAGPVTVFVLGAEEPGAGLAAATGADALSVAEERLAQLAVPFTCSPHDHMGVKVGAVEGSTLTHGSPKMLTPNINWKLGFTLQVPSV